MTTTAVLCDMAIDRIDSDALLDAVFDALDRGDGGWVVTVNLDILRRHAHDASARDLYGAADLRVADGMPLVWASRLAARPVPARVTGSGSAWLLAERAATAGRDLYLLGGEPGAAEAAGAALEARYDGLRVCGTSSPEVSSPATTDQVDGIAEALARSRPDIVLVGLGSPKQEQLIRQLRARFPGMWFVGVGVTLSFLSGARVRAPEWVQRAGLEWVHRLASEPKRLARRYLVDDLPFAARLFADALGRRAQALSVEPPRAWVVTPGDLYGSGRSSDHRPMRTPDTPRSPYTAPALRREGTVRELTFGQAVGNFLDAAFPNNTPVSQLTFS